MREMNMFGSLCGIYDCECNVDNCCKFSCNFDDSACKINRIIPERTLQKNFEKEFNPKQCIKLTVHTSSKGAQDKWSTLDNKYIIKDRFYYQLRYWNDDVVEVIASRIGKQLGLNILEQNLCKLGDRECSFSRNWGKKRFIPYERIDNAARYMNYNNLDDRVKYIIEVLSKEVMTDASDYVKGLLTIDRLMGNEDRHASNFGILISEQGEKEIAPIFDCGLGLFEHDLEYQPLDLEQCIKKMQHRTFGDWRKISDKFFLHEGKIKVERSLLPNKLAEPYLRFSSNELGMELIICD